MPGFVTILLVMGGLVAIYRLLIRVTIRGGRSSADAASIANQVLAESDLYRGARSEADPVWDGQHRLAEPTSEGLILWPGVVAPSTPDDERDTR